VRLSTALRSLACSLLAMLRCISSACSARLSSFSCSACAGISAPNVESFLTRPDGARGFGETCARSSPRSAAYIVSAQRLHFGWSTSALKAPSGKSCRFDSCFTEAHQAPLVQVHLLLLECHPAARRSLHQPPLPRVCAVAALVALLRQLHGYAACSAR